MQRTITELNIIVTLHSLLKEEYLAVEIRRNRKNRIKLNMVGIDTDAKNKANNENFIQ